MAQDLGSDLFGRSFLTLRDFDAGEIDALLELAARLKIEKREQREVRHLAGRSIALIFEKDSTRTRIGFEVAAYDQGAHVTYLGPSGQPRRQEGIGQGHGPCPRPRLRRHRVPRLPPGGRGGARGLLRRAGLQRPHRRGSPDPGPGRPPHRSASTSRSPLGDVAMAYVGDAHSNMGDELLMGCATMGMDLRIVAPRAVWPHEEFLAWAAGRVPSTAAPGSRSPRTSRRASAVPTSSTRTCGSRWASRRRSGTSGSRSSGRTRWMPR